MCKTFLTGLADGVISVENGGNRGDNYLSMGWTSLAGGLVGKMYDILVCCVTV